MGVADIINIDKTNMSREEGRAWVEIDLDALAYNAGKLRSLAPPGCELMAVVKTDAYGMGAVRVAQRLRDEGVKSFAVATVDEGVQLRESGLEGDILVLTYTRPSRAALLSDYRLAQLIVDKDYAIALDSMGHKLRVHVALDTGMHREGIDAASLPDIESVFLCDNLTVEGISTHLASSDSLDAGDMEFTYLQIERYYSAIESLVAMGYDVGKLHIQASYGIYNYPDLRCDFIRAGIALCGALGHDEEMITRPELRPVVSVRAVVAQVRWIGAGESVSYGRTFTTEKPIKLATICIGYADGVPRHMSGNNGACIIRGIKSPIVGRVCMDLIMADVSAIEAVAPGDVATLIGADGGEEIRCEDVARASGTIANEILSRLGTRLPRVYVSA